MTLPIIVSVPHAGLRVPPEVAPACRLNPAQIAEDGDEHAAAIYDIAAEARHFVTTDIARAVVDLNRAEDDRRPDGVVKTHTCFNVPVWREPLGADVVEGLLAPAPPAVSRAAPRGSPGRARTWGVDCHTMMSRRAADWTGGTGAGAAPRVSRERRRHLPRGVDGLPPAELPGAVRAAGHRQRAVPGRLHHPFSRGGDAVGATGALARAVRDRRREAAARAARPCGPPCSASPPSDRPGLRTCPRIALRVAAPLPPCF